MVANVFQTDAAEAFELITWRLVLWAALLGGSRGAGDPAPSAPPWLAPRARAQGLRAHRLGRCPGRSGAFLFIFLRHPGAQPPRPAAAARPDQCARCHAFLLEAPACNAGGPAARRAGRERFDMDMAATRESLLDVLQRGGVDVLWTDNNSGCKGAFDRVPRAVASQTGPRALARGRVPGRKLAGRPRQAARSRRFGPRRVAGREGSVPSRHALMQSPPTSRSGFPSCSGCRPSALRAGISMRRASAARPRSPFRTTTSTPWYWALMGVTTSVYDRSSDVLAPYRTSKGG